MTNDVINIVVEVMPHFEGYAYPNEATPQPLWGVLIVLFDGVQSLDVTGPLEVFAGANRWQRDRARG